MSRPESTGDAQLAYGSDILMALDECPEYPVHATSTRARRWGGRSAGRAPVMTYLQRIALETRHALFPRAGSMYATSAGMLAQLADLNADGYAIGGLSVGEPPAASL